MSNFAAVLLGLNENVFANNPRVLTASQRFGLIAPDRQTFNTHVFLIIR